MTIILASVFVITGALFALIAALGVLRMPDLYCRMHAATKAGAFGVAQLLIALAIALPTARTIIMCALILVFFYLTAPVAAHMIGRVALVRKVTVWKPKTEETTSPERNIHLEYISQAKKSGD